MRRLRSGRCSVLLLMHCTDRNWHINASCTWLLTQNGLLATGPLNSHSRRWGFRLMNTHASSAAKYARKAVRYKGINISIGTEHVLKRSRLPVALNRRRIFKRHPGLYVPVDEQQVLRAFRLFSRPGETRARLTLQWLSLIHI